MTSTRWPAIFMSCSAGSTCAGWCWPGSPWAPVRWPATWQFTAQGGSRRPCWSRRCCRSCSRRTTVLKELTASVFDAITARIAADRPAAMKDFMDRCYNVDLLGGDRVSDQAWQNSFYVAISASAHAALRCVTACLEDFRGDLATITIPVLVIHGDQDRVLPYEATSRRLPALLKNARSTVIAGGPHAIIWTHADEVNQALLDFIGHLSRTP